MANRDSILLVMPFGMGLRNIVLNRRIWNYLIGKYYVDIVSPIQIENHDDLGIRNVFTSKRVSFLRGAFRAFARRIADRLRYINLIHFFLRAGGPDGFAPRYQQYLASGQLNTLMRWALLRSSAITSPLRRLLLFFLRYYPIHPFDTRTYKFVILGHNSELECLVYGLLANQKKIPVVCAVMGMDNLIHGPFLFTPDLLLLWGQDQVRDFRRYQLPLDPKLGRTVCAVVGSTIHDTYRECAATVSGFRQRYDLTEEDKVILFAAFTERSLALGRTESGIQPAVCDMILAFIRNHRLNAKLLIRTRPGYDEQLWTDFYQNNRDLVRLQSPGTAAYDKSGKIPFFNMAAEKKEVELFAETMRESTLVISPSPSTFLIDAMALGRPAFDLLFDPTATGVHTNLAAFSRMVARNPKWLTAKTATNREQVDTLLYQVFFELEADEFIATDLTEDVMARGESSAGDRWVEAVDEFSDSLERGLP